MTRGNIIGPDNTPSISGASGLWSPDEIYEARLLADWPFVIAGYIFEWASISGSNFTQIWRIADATDTALQTYQANESVFLQGQQGGAFSSTTKGYYFWSSQRLNSYLFASDTYSLGAIGSSWPEANRTEGASFQSATFGYASNGSTLTSNPFYATAFKWSFATEARTAVGSTPIDVDRRSGSNSTTDGYVAGGRRPSVAGYDVILKMPFSTETWSTLASTLTSARTTGDNRTATEATAAYWNKDATNLDKFVFSTEVVSGVTTASRAAGSFRYSTPTRASWAPASGATTVVSFFDFSIEDMSATTVTYGAGRSNAVLRQGGLFSQV